ncbi:MAG: TonB-dependent receptor [Synergistaceae bacterium]|jgi:outer membrane cobalamin receptor|nr:TonB-dependent receptor [Synergistaceae bacterium]
MKKVAFFVFLWTVALAGQTRAAISTGTPDAGLPNAGLPDTGLLDAGTPVAELPEETVVGSVVYDEAEDRYLSPGMVTVIRPEERKGEQRTLPDLLEEAPGLRVIRLQGRHGYAVASVRGSSSAQVAVYVDGVLMNLQSEPAVDLSALPVNAVDRIEVYRGYIPAKFGAQAMGGVINIVTKKPQTTETNLSIGTGSFGRFKGTLSLGTPMGDGKFFGSFGYETYDGDFEYSNDDGTPYNSGDDYRGRRRGNGFENTDVLLKWEDEHWRARASWVRRSRNLALAAPGLDRPGEAQRPGALLDTDRWDVSVGRTRTLGRRRVPGGGDWGWEAFYTGQKKDYDSRRGSAPSPIGGSYVTKSEYETRRAGLSLNANVSAGERHFLELLAGYSEERLNVRGDSLFEYLNGIESYRREEWNFSLQDTIALDRAGSFLFTPSVRWHGQDGEDHFSWQAALSKEFSFSSSEGQGSLIPAGLAGTPDTPSENSRAGRWMIKSAFGAYSRAPNLYERYGDGAFILPSADGELEWETGTQFDVGVMWNGEIGGARANAALSVFWRNSENLIEFDMENPRFGRYRNIAEARVKGVEFEAAFDWKRWDFSLSGTWMDGENRTPGDEGAVRFDGKTLPNRPDWSVSARLVRKLFDASGEKRGSVFAEYLYTGANYADSSEKVLFDARSVWNAGVRYDLSGTTQLTLGVNDIFDKADDWRMRPDGLNGPVRMLWYPVEGRTFYATLTMTF